MKFRNLGFLLSISLFTTPLFAQNESGSSGGNVLTPLQAQYERILGETKNQRTKQVFSTQGVLEAALQINEHLSSVVQIVGYSGAGYADKWKMFHAVSGIVEESRDALINLGATSEGIGQTYTLIQDLDRGGSAPIGLVVGGMVAEGAVQDHVNSIKMGWDGVISPHQDLLFLYPKNRDVSPNVQLLIDAANRGMNSRLVVLEGGEQSLKEIIELLVEARTQIAESGEAIEIDLVGHFEPEYASTDKGYRASTNALQIISEKPNLLSKSVRVFVSELTPAGNLERTKISEFVGMIRDKAYLRHQMELVEKSLVINKIRFPLPEDETFEALRARHKLEQRKRYFEVMLQLDDVADGVIKECLARETAREAGRSDSEVFDGLKDDEARKVSGRTGELLSEEDRRAEERALNVMSPEQREKYLRAREREPGQAVKDAIRDAFKK